MATATVFLMAILIISLPFVRGKTRRRAYQGRIMQMWAGWCCRLAGITVRKHGTVPPSRGILLTPNHTGYADIFVLAAILPISFVSKDEVARWPLVGLGARLTGHIFIARKRSRPLVEAGEALQKCLSDGGTVCVFCEGTSFGDRQVHPFMPSLLEPAIRVGSPVVPVAIRWSARRPGVSYSDDIAYWGDHEIGPHILRLLGLGGIEADVFFGRPEDPSGRNRKDLAAELRGRVEDLASGGEGADCRERCQPKGNSE